MPRLPDLKFSVEVFPDGTNASHCDRSHAGKTAADGACRRAAWRSARHASPFWTIRLPWPVEPTMSSSNTFQGLGWAVLGTVTVWPPSITTAWACAPCCARTGSREAATVGSHRDARNGAERVARRAHLQLARHVVHLLIERWQVSPMESASRSSLLAAAAELMALPSSKQDETNDCEMMLQPLTQRNGRQVADDV